MDFATVRLGKTSVDAIKSINNLTLGIVENIPIDVTCTQVPLEFIPNTWVFIWLGSDNNKGMPTAWKQGFKALGILKKISRGENYNDNSTFTIDIKYIFDEAVSRLDFLKFTPQAYYWFSAMPIIGLDDHSNQTVRMIQPNAERNDIRALLYAFNKIITDFSDNIRFLDDNFESLVADYEIPNPIDANRKNSKLNRSGVPLQVIYYGAPGTGKSHQTDRIVKCDKNNEHHQRTTFHPDTDYSSFVGCYKPSKENGELTYRFVPQVFLKAYVAAWRNLDEPYYLIIEEINRGNCAQIFGDIFQLLDRRDDGFSKYHISTDTDIENFLCNDNEGFNGINAEDIITPDDVNIEGLLSGKIMQLPRNLHIYATMNTSDQSLFPIDSAFKRRWDWEYKPIEQPSDPKYRDWKIVTDDNAAYDWWKFLQAVNDKIFSATHSEDKKLGYWFTKADDKKRITQETFIGKVLFYLWNDVFKDYALTEETAFKGLINAESREEEEYTFTDFFKSVGVTERIHRMMSRLGVDKEIYQISNDVVVQDKDGSKYSYVLNGELYSGIGKAIRAIVTVLGEHYSFDEISTSFNNIVGKTHNGEPAIKKSLPSELNPDKNGRNRWYAEPFTDVNGEKFSLVSLWPDSYYSRIKLWVEQYPKLFPKGFVQNENID